MIEEYKLLISSTPSEIKFTDVFDIKRLYERILAVRVFYPNLIEVCEGYIEFCPDNEPPLINELIFWIWAFRPNLSPVILKHTLSNDVRLLIDSYQINEMKNWWDHINEN